MKRLTLSLLLSFAPAALNANDVTKCNNGCERAEQVQDERCCGLAELVMVDALQAYEATGAFVTATKQSMSADGWNFVTELLTATFGAPAAQTDSSLSFEFDRDAMNLVQWFETLAALEVKIVEVKSIIEKNPNCTGGTLAFDLK